MKFAGVFGILVGIMMMGQWIFFLAAGQVPELQTEPYRIALHLAAEGITALGLVITGAALLSGKLQAVRAYLVFAGMLAYSVIASPGYFVQKGQWALAAMFAALLILDAASIIRATSGRRRLDRLAG